MSEGETWCKSHRHSAGTPGLQWATQAANGQDLAVAGLRFLGEMVQTDVVQEGALSTAMHVFFSMSCLSA